MCGGGGSSTPDTSQQEAEATRQRDIENQLASDRLAQEQGQAQRQRDDEERRYQEQRDQQTQESQRQYDTLNAEIARQEAARQAAEARAEQERQSVLAEQQARAERSRAYTTGRQHLMDTAVDNINTAYSGFNDAFFDEFAKDFVDTYKPKIDQEYQDQSRKNTFAFADTGNLKSSAAARSFGDLARGKAEKETEAASEGADRAGMFRDQITGQKSDAISALYSSGAVGSDNLPDGVTDVGGALTGIGERLGSLSQTAANRAKQVTRPSFASNLNLDLGSYAKRPSYSV